MPEPVAPTATVIGTDAVDTELSESTILHLKWVRRTLGTAIFNSALDAARESVRRALRVEADKEAAQRERHAAYEDHLRQVNKT